jgi:hypothetical protein
LWDSKRRRVQNIPARVVPKGAKAIQQLPAVFSKARAREAPHVLEHHSLGQSFPNQTKSLRKEVALIICTKLLASH